MWIMGTKVKKLMKPMKTITKMLRNMVKDCEDDDDGDNVEQEGGQFCVCVCSKGSLLEDFHMSGLTYSYNYKTFLSS
jgi:hypothetical protein